MIKEISSSQVLDYCLDYFQLSSACEQDELLLIYLLRRTAGIICPCSRVSLRNAVKNSLDHLPLNSIGLSEKLDSLIEQLIIVGDLLELADVSIDDKKAAGSWVFAAPPSFVERENGLIYLLGVVPDQESFLSSGLERRIINKHVLRQIKSVDGEDLTIELIDLGMNKLMESTWLKHPRQTDPEKLISSYNDKLDHNDNFTEIEGLQILDGNSDVNFYLGRWCTPSNQKGRFLARRPQEFGSPLWCYVMLDAGVSQKILDFPLKGYRWRACDASWHLQMAIDFVKGNPQKYSKVDVGNGVQFDFFSPIPIWVQRRLMILGNESASKRGLLAYVIPYSEVEQEEKNLRENLWLVSKEK